MHYIFHRQISLFFSLFHLAHMYIIIQEQLHFNYINGSARSKITCQRYKGFCLTFNRHGVGEWMSDRVSERESGRVTWKKGRPSSRIINVFLSVSASSVTVALVASYGENVDWIESISMNTLVECVCALGKLTLRQFKSMTYLILLSQYIPYNNRSLMHWIAKLGVCIRSFYAIIFGVMH